MLALSIGMVLNYSINAFKKATEPKYAVDITFHSASRFNYLETEDTLVLASCMTGMNVRMQYSKDTLIFSGEGMQFGYKPRMHVDSSTVMATDIKNNPFYFRRVQRDNGHEALWFSTGNVLNVMTTEDKCFEFEK